MSTLSSEAGSKEGERSTPVELEYLPRNFSQSTNPLLGYAGLPAHIVRAKQFEDMIGRFWANVESRYQELKEQFPPGPGFSRAWKTQVQLFDYQTMAAVAEKFNANFPIEANLPMDPATRDFTYQGTPFREVTTPTADDILRRFPGRE